MVSDETPAEGDGVPARKRRVRNPQAHRAAILAAARDTFAERGYSRATIREIARRANVTHGLVVRHFGTKERLFLEAMPGPRDLWKIVPGESETLPERVAAAFVERMEHANGNDPFIALLRSAATDEENATRLYEAMQETSIEAYRTMMSGPDVEERVDLLAAHLIGVAFSRYVVRKGPLAEMSPDTLTRYLARDLRAILAPID